ncbi:hypothetical protein A2154_03890 [Candidatus Gottesmanbacteria bacterium RBG_16_43_7]|uniref:Ribbon-helix-helix protein CopG domain-containing protein n=1 Tax=Candidatus Gottesmanbacteria bacterium RBG_16_43_7 TaxID=1798373 RepID=A0A1F5Z9A0_9BACT|nr:MAG: hypothetical protein A2154_03890 [Candidatus Gottesmanbacteria bacterium RBG_16_43_7]
MQTQTFNISMPRELVSNLDKVARREYRNRSELIKEAVRLYIEDRREWDEIFSYGTKQTKSVGVKTEKDINRLVKAYRKGK